MAWQCLVERRIESSHVDRVRQMLARGPIRREAVRIVQRRERAEFVDRAFDSGVDDHGAGKGAAVDDAMADAGDGFPAQCGREIGEGCLERVRHAGDAFDQTFAEEADRNRKRRLRARFRRARI